MPPHALDLRDREEQLSRHRPVLRLDGAQQNRMPKVSPHSHMQHTCWVKQMRGASVERRAWRRCLRSRMLAD